MKKKRLVYGLKIRPKMEMTNKMYQLKLIDENDIYYPLVVIGQDGVTLIDTGMPGQFSQLEEQLHQCGVAVSEIARIVITHAHIDHIGNIDSVIKVNPDVEIWIHEDDKRKLYEDVYILAETNNNTLTKSNIKIVRDRDVLPIFGNMTVIHTPGHTPGHICLYVETEKLLIAGDQLNCPKGELVGPDSYYTPDMKLAMESMQQLISLDFERVYCYHGGLFEHNPTQVIKKLIEE